MPRVRCRTGKRPAQLTRSRPAGMEQRPTESGARLIPRTARQHAHRHCLAGLQAHHGVHTALHVRIVIREAGPRHAVLVISDVQGCLLIVLVVQDGGHDGVDEEEIGPADGSGEDACSRVVGEALVVLDVVEDDGFSLVMTASILVHEGVEADFGAF